MELGISLGQTQNLAGNEEGRLCEPVVTIADSICSKVADGASKLRVIVVSAG